jgi:hypothetical protein
LFVESQVTITGATHPVQAHSYEEFLSSGLSLLDFFSLTFPAGVAEPSVPTRQFNTVFLFPPPAMYSLKHAVESITALQLSLLTSQGRVCASAEVTKIAARLSETRILTVNFEILFCIGSNS